jgi:hypothetical protein
MTTRVRRSSPGAALSGSPSIDDKLGVALALLAQAFAYARDAGADPWDFALEIDLLYDRGMTISDLRWLVAKNFAEHGQESSVYGSPHRSFRRGKGFIFDQTTSVVLTPSGAAFADQFLSAPVVSPPAAPPIEPAALAAGTTAALEVRLPPDRGPEERIHAITRPCWNSRRRELSWRGAVVKRYRVPAQNQELILTAFEEQGWVDHVDDPLPVRHDVDPRTRLHDTINRLNGCQTNRLLRFHGNGSGTGISWELLRTKRMRP